MPVNAGAPTHSSARVGRFMALCLGHSTASCADFMVVLVESEPLQFKPIKSRHRTAICENVQSALWDHGFKDREAIQEASGRTLEVKFELGTKHVACKCFELPHSTTSNGRQRQRLPSSLGTLDATSKVFLHCGKQKRDSTSAVKMLHQMSVWVVVVALRLVLNNRLSINSRRLKNGNCNYYLTGKLIPKM